MKPPSMALMMESMVSKNSAHHSINCNDLICMSVRLGNRLSSSCLEEQVAKLK